MGGASSSAPAALGHALANLGGADALGFDSSVKVVMNLGGIDPWSCQELLRENLERQTNIAHKSPLRHMPVMQGLELFNSQVSQWSWNDGTLSKEGFLQSVKQHHAHGVEITQEDEEVLKDVFDSLDYDNNQRLSRGEWA